MKKAERRMMEDMLTALEMEDVKLETAEMEQMLANAKEQMLQRSDKPAKRPAARKTGRRILLVAAAAMGFLICSFVYTAAMPATVSSANNFLRSTAIWVNNTLHLGFKFETPAENDSVLLNHDMIFDTVEAAAAQLSLPLLKLNDDRLTLTSVTISPNDSGISHVTTVYNYGTEQISIYTFPVGSEHIVNMSNTSECIIPWSEGELFCWYSESLSRAYTLYRGVDVDFFSSVPYEVFLEFCQSITLVN
ncbi:MAG: hypothetical protein J1E43_11865 [Christensenellaceae bacterium]|nr:hypothetical protein [Christensenellaceae bacterium]